MTSKRSLKTAFITTVATTAAVFSLAGGCGGQVFSDGAGGAGSTSGTGANPPQPNCPTELPGEGESCSPNGLSCNYPDLTCSPTASCNDGQWQVATEPACNPPPCPAFLPQHDSSCADYAGYHCEYESGCPDLPNTAWCNDATLTWSVSETFCNPPPPDYCFNLSSAESCQSEPDCAWQEPGCASDDVLPVAGCHPTSLSCADAEWLCWEGTSCQLVSVDPCWDKDCNICSEMTSLCVPDVDAGG